jgi:hypothetical protein
MSFKGDENEEIIDAIQEARPPFEAQGPKSSEIAEHPRMSKRAVGRRLVNSVADTRAIRGRKLLSRQPLERLYVAERKSIATISAELGLSEYLVRNSLRRHGIATRRRSHCLTSRFPGLESLRIGESILLPRPRSRGKWQAYFYYAAAKWGFKISVNAIGDENARVTRLA